MSKMKNWGRWLLGAIVAGFVLVAAAVLSILAQAPRPKRPTRSAKAAAALETKQARRVDEKTKLELGELKSIETLTAEDQAKELERLINSREES